MPIKQRLAEYGGKNEEYLYELIWSHFQGMLLSMQKQGAKNMWRILSLWRYPCHLNNICVCACIHKYEKKKWDCPKKTLVYIFDFWVILIFSKISIFLRHDLYIMKCSFLSVKSDEYWQMYWIYPCTNHHKRDLVHFHNPKPTQLLIGLLLLPRSDFSVGELHMNGIIHHVFLYGVFHSA